VIGSSGTYPHAISRPKEGPQVPDTAFNQQFLRVARDVAFYPYRTAMVTSHFLSLPLRSEAMKALEVELASLAGVRRDNHTVYKITTTDGATLYVMFSDNKVTFGDGIREGSW
jgi:hypothetical protein